MHLRNLVSNTWNEHTVNSKLLHWFGCSNIYFHIALLKYLIFPVQNITFIKLHLFSYNREHIWQYCSQAQQGTGTFLMALPFWFWTLRRFLPIVFDEIEVHLLIKKNVNAFVKRYWLNHVSEYLTSSVGSCFPANSIFKSIFNAFFIHYAALQFSATELCSTIDARPFQKNTFFLLL